MIKLVKSKTRRAGWLRLVMVLALAVQLFGLLSQQTAPAQAEGFVNTAFQNQWAVTDQDVANGKVSRTFFWGPQAFAHTAEVYAESPTGTRQVQYFDKARMELTKRGGQDPNAVTNGLLTVELVSGKLQLGDNKFLQNSPSNTPVAGDPPGGQTSAATPSYASFNQGKLAYGVSGAISSTDRTGQFVQEAVDNTGAVSSLSQLPATVKYARYFSSTGHNVADVFYNFFLNPPLGNDKWLAVMGYPITEPFWSQTPVTVGGQPRAVLIQLFERRTLTYTPANPTGFQVEMGNIGQHYYSWRYGVNAADPVPGNFRVILAQDKSLYSYSVRDGSSLNLGAASDYINQVWPSTQGKALLKTQPPSSSTDTKAYLADLRIPNSFQPLPLPKGVSEVNVLNATWSADGTRLFVLMIGKNADTTSAATYAQVYTLNSQGVTDNFTAYTFADPFSFQTIALSADGKYLAGFVDKFSPDSIQPLMFSLIDLTTKATSLIKVTDKAQGGSLQWLGNSDRLLITAFTGRDTSTQPPTKRPDKLLTYDVPAATVTTLLEDATLNQAVPSPDGNYIALAFNDSVGVVTGVQIRALANPQTALTSTYVHSFSGYVGNVQWGADGSYLHITTFLHGIDTFTEIVNSYSAGTGLPITFELQSSGVSKNSLAPKWGGPFYTVGSNSGGVTVGNLDGSDTLVLAKSVNYDAFGITEVVK